MIHLFIHNHFIISDYHNMAGLKADLDSYLSGSKASNTLSNLSKSFSLPTLKSPFGNKDSFNAGQDEEALLSDGESNGNGNNIFFARLWF